MMDLSVTRHRLQVTEIEIMNYFYRRYKPLKPGSTLQDGATLGQAEESGGP